MAFLDDVLAGGEGERVAARPCQPAVCRQQVADLPGEPDLRGDEHDQVVADPFQVGD
jgi:hypothetical protein